jgi:hypothetical protein
MFTEGCGVGCWCVVNLYSFGVGCWCAVNSQLLSTVCAFIVDYSVANTAKRAFLIWLSVLMFGNPVTLLSGLGTCTVIVGVLLYNKAQEYDRLKLNKVGGHRKPIALTRWACEKAVVVAGTALISVQMSVLFVSIFIIFLVSSLIYCTLVCPHYHVTC